MIRSDRLIASPLAPVLHLRARIASWRSRQRLAELDAAALRDIGLTHTQAAREAARPLWDAPDHWSR